MPQTIGPGPMQPVTGETIGPGPMQTPATTPATETPKVSRCANPTIDQIQAAIAEKQDELLALLDFFRALREANGFDVVGPDGSWSCTFTEAQS